MAELPVTMSGSKPLITAKINGEDAQFVADSGAFFSMITAASAAQYKLKLRPAPFGFYIKGIGGNIDPSIATVKVFTIAGIPVHDVEFFVGGGEVGGLGSVGVLGQNFFRIGDVEYDLAKGVIRLIKADGCSGTNLAYWVKPSEPLSLMDIAWGSPISPHTTGTAFINGARIRVMFDTGAGNSILSQRAAARAGVKPDAEGVIDGGYSRGIGRGAIKTYIGRFASFKIGDEEIRNTRLRFGEIGVDNADMLIGTDFFLSHRIYVASSQHRLYFTYNGGPVFNLTSPPAGRAPPEAPPDAQAPNGAAAGGAAANGAANTAAEAAAANAATAAAVAAAAAAKAIAAAQAPAAAAGAPTAGIPTPAKIDKDEPADASAFARRGTAFAARHDYERAIADLTRACELDPDNADYRFQRGVVYRENKQIDLAAADFNRALEMKPEDVAALVARAQLRQRAHDAAGAGADLEAADRYAAKESDLRLSLAQGYASLDLLPQSLEQYDLWISFHSQDSRMVQALGARCWNRALRGLELPKALSDCDAALRLTGRSNPLAIAILNGRGLVQLRMTEYDKSIADYDDALKLAPKNASVLYGRGIDKLRKKKTAEGNADLAAATALSAPIADQFKLHGIVP